MYSSIAGAIAGESDGLLVILPPTGGESEADVRMRMFNPDGTEAEMCGNGIRCVARYLEERGEGDSFLIETRGGTIGARLVSREPYAIETRHPVPSVERERELRAAGRRWRVVPVSVGNPHAVVFVDDPDRIEVATFGPAIERDPSFPEGANVHFVQVADRSTLRVRHWERGAGATRACGTGIVASAAAAIAAGRVHSPVTVHVPGGTLIVAWNGRTDASLTGPVEHTGARDLVVA